MASRASAVRAIDLTPRRAEPFVSESSHSGPVLPARPTSTDVHLEATSTTFDGVPFRSPSALLCLVPDGPFPDNAQEVPPNMLLRSRRTPRARWLAAGAPLIAVLLLASSGSVQATPTPPRFTKKVFDLTSSGSVTLTKIHYTTPNEVRILTITPDANTTIDQHPATQVFSGYETVSNQADSVGAIAAINGDFAHHAYPTHWNEIDTFSTVRPEDSRPIPIRSVPSFGLNSRSRNRFGSLISYIPILCALASAQRASLFLLPTARA